MSIVAPTPAAIEEAAHRLSAGELIGLPTETVYGLAADAASDHAVAAVFVAKGRPRFNPLITHVSSIGMAAAYGKVTQTAEQLMEMFWPGPLTFVLTKLDDAPLSTLVTADLPTVALRSPVHPVARALLTAFGRGLAAPSANKSGRVSPTLPAHVEQELGASVSLILDGGPCPIGIESTVLDLSAEKPVLLRPGSITREMLQAVIGPIALSDDSQIKSPGQLASHYAPLRPVRLNAQEARAGEALLAFGKDAPPHDGPFINLSAQGDLVEAAARLFSALRELDRPEVSAIAVMPVPNTGIGEAINDRLIRAAATKQTH